MHIRDVTQILVNFDFVSQELIFSVETLQSYFSTSKFTFNNRN